MHVMGKRKMVIRNGNFRYSGGEEDRNIIYEANKVAFCDNNNTQVWMRVILESVYHEIIH